MRKQVPPGPEDMDCHRCLPDSVPMSEVCHRCPLWQSLRGKDPNTGQEIDEWGCVDAWALTGQLEIAKMVRGGTVATESFRNEMVALSAASLNASMAPRQAYQPHSQIAGQKAPILIEAAS